MIPLTVFYSRLHLCFEQYEVCMHDMECCNATSKDAGSIMCCIMYGYTTQQESIVTFFKRRILATVSLCMAVSADSANLMVSLHLGSYMGETLKLRTLNTQTLKPETPKRRPLPLIQISNTLQPEPLTPTSSSNPTEMPGSWTDQHWKRCIFRSNWRFGGSAWL